MTHEPRTTDEIYDSLKSSLTGKIATLSNFTERSFNYVWSQAFATEIRQLEILTVVAELAGWIDYTGGEVTQSDLEELEIADDVDVEDIQQFMESDYLDEYVKIVGISRLPGSRATGNVTFTTQAAKTTIPSGTRVTTTPDSDGDTIDFVTTENAETADGVTTITDVEIQATDVGTEFNVPADTIVRLADPPIGVRGVTNPASTTGGTDQETNDELRARAKEAVQTSSQGGTTDGIKGYIRQNIEGVGQGDIIIDEFTDQSPPFVDVIVDGGLESEVLDAIDFSRPTGIRHNLARPEVIQLGFSIDLDGTDIDTAGVQTDTEDFLLELGIGENFYQDAFVQEIMSSDEDIENIDTLGGFIEKVTNETFEYDSGQTDYRLDYTYEDTNGTISVEDENGNVYTEGADFSVNDQTGDGWPETIVWGGGSTPADGDDFFVDYDVTVAGSTLNQNKYHHNLVRDEIFSFNIGQQDSFDYNNTQVSYELNFIPFENNISIQDENTTVFTEDTDWQLAALGDEADEETIAYSTGTTAYQLSNEIEIDHVSIIDEQGNIYIRGTDYTTSDSDGDGFDDTIDWDTNNSVPADGDNFTVNYNGYPQHIRWDQNDSTPPQDDQFTVTYDQVYYETEYEIVETPDGIIRDGSGDVYNEDTEYETIDETRDGENDGIYWLSNPASLNDDEEFYFSYLNEGDSFFGTREKPDPGTITVSNQ